MFKQSIQFHFGRKVLLEMERTRRTGPADDASGQAQTPSSLWAPVDSLRTLPCQKGFRVSQKISLWSPRKNHPHFQKILGRFLSKNSYESGHEKHNPENGGKK